MLFRFCIVCRKILFMQILHIKFRREDDVGNFEIFIKEFVHRHVVVFVQARPTHFNYLLLILALFLIFDFIISCVTIFVKNFFISFFLFPLTVYILSYMNIYVKSFCINFFRRYYFEYSDIFY